MIGLIGVRNFMLYKKPQKEEDDGDDRKQVVVGIITKSYGSWKAWFNKSLNLKVSLH